MSIVQISGISASRLFRESLYKMRVFGSEENSRNGKVLSIETPVVLRLLDPTQRVLTDPIRDANPFFHAMEFVWMMSGTNDVTWLAQFNKNMVKYTDDGVVVHGAYGHRWRRHFGLDQIKKLIKEIKRDKENRRLVINMWNPDADLGYNGTDVPCNTQLLFRVVEGELQMTVINRSNDLIWGALGANICHMTMLQELIANAVGLPLGIYYVFTQNLHIYESVPNFDYYMKGVPEARDIYATEVDVHVPILAQGESYPQFVEDCEKLVQYGAAVDGLTTQWMKSVGIPIFNAWLSRKKEDLDAIAADDWRIACTEWVERRKSAAVGDKQRDYYASVLGRKQVADGMVLSPLQPDPLAGVDHNQCDVGNASTESCTNDTLPSQPL